jgi:hypothetical protein
MKIFGIGSVVNGKVCVNLVRRFKTRAVDHTIDVKERYLAIFEDGSSLNLREVENFLLNSQA